MPMSVSFHTRISFADNHGPSDKATVSSRLWKEILDAGNYDDLDHVVVSLSFKQLDARKDVNPPRSLLFYIKCAMDIPSTVITLPSEWKSRCRSLFGDVTSQSLSTRHWVSPVELLLLEEVFVTALSDVAFQVARDNQTKFSNWLSGSRRIIRGGDQHACTLFRDCFIDQPGVSSAATFVYQVATTTPVMQGYAKPGITRIYVAPAPLTIARESDMINRPAPPHCNPIQLPHGGVVHTKDSIDDAFEIDERFFASSLRALPLSSSTKLYRYPGETPEYNDSGDTGHSKDKSHPTLAPFQLHSGAVFQAEALNEPVDSDADVNASIFVRTTDLVKIGVLEGDWAIASEPYMGGYRLVQIFTADNLIQIPGVVLVSPLLLHNISHQKWMSGGMPIILRASPFGSRPPSLPTSTAMTLACITSPASSNRLYQPLYHQALKAHFDGKRTLVKKDDLVAIAINTNEFQNTDEMDGVSVETYDCYDYCYRFDPGFRAAYTVIIFFVISSIQYSVVTETETEEQLFDFYDSSKMGELGCWIEPSATTMIQTGFKHAVVPDAFRFLNIEFSRNTMESQEINDSSSAAGPLLKLHDLASAVITSMHRQYDLCLSVLLKGGQGMEMSLAAHIVAHHLGWHIFEINCYEVAGESDIKTEGFLRATFEKASACSPCILLLQHINAFVQTTQPLDVTREQYIIHVLKECINDLQIDWQCSGFPVIVVGTICNSEQISSDLLSAFKQEILFAPPTELERVNTLKLLSEDNFFTPDISFNLIAMQTAAFAFEDLKEILSRACWNATERVYTEIADLFSLNHNISVAGFPLSVSDIDWAIQQVRASYSTHIGAPKIPNVTWDDVGGLAKVKEDILDTIQLPLEQPELFADGLKKRSGLLLYGPPGTGKTLLAKAVATSCSLNFFSIKGPELLNMYIGESEANVRRVFQQARDATPCVIFFDELDSVAPKRGNHGDSGGVMDRIVSQLLAELDGISGSQGGTDIFVIGATNRPDLLDPALLRPGRFDRMLYLGVSDTHNAQFHILAALTRKFTLDDHLDLQNIAEQCPFNFTGADFYALCSDAMLKAMSRKAQEIENKIVHLNHSEKLPGHHYPITAQYYLGELLSASDTDVRISQWDFEEALDELVPSVSQSEMDHYAAVQQRFSQQN